MRVDDNQIDSLLIMHYDANDRKLLLIISLIVTSGSASSMALSVPPPSVPSEEKQLIAGTCVIDPL
jgi:hypothetical protein